MSSIIVNNKGGRETYGFRFPEAVPQPHIELFGYALQRGEYGKLMQEKWLHQHGDCLGDFHFLEPIEHMINFVKMGWPTDVEIQVRGYWNKPMLKLWEELCNSDDVGVAGNASSSKSFGCSVFLDFDWMSAPSVTSTYVASTSLSASEDRIWGTLVRLHKACRYKTGHVIDYKKCIVLERPVSGKDDDRDYSNAIKAIAFPPGAEGRKAVDTTRGRKNQRMRVCVDELAEMESYVNQVRSNLAANNDLIYIGIANPLPGENPHRDLCEPKEGWDSVNKSMERWETKTGTCIFLSGERSPNFEAPEDEPEPFPYLLTRKKKARMLEIAHGNENSLDFQRNAIGFWFLDNIDTSIVSRALIVGSNTSYEPKWKGTPKQGLAYLDCALTSGGDGNELSFGFLGDDRDDGRSLLFYQGSKGYSVDQGVVFEDNLAQQIVPDLIAMGIEPQNFGMDIDGAGGKVMAAIIREWLKFDKTAATLCPVSAMGKPTERIISSLDKRKADEVYDRRISEMWFAMHTALVTRTIFGISMKDHGELISQLTARQYTYKNKKLSIEIKADMKARIGRSPDRGDSCVGLLEIARKKGLPFIDDVKVANDRQLAIESRDEEQIEYDYSGVGDGDPDGW